VLYYGRSTSFKVNETGTNQKPICDFLLGFYCNYMLTFCRFRNRATYWSKISVFWLSLLTQSGLKSLERGSAGTHDTKVGRPIERLDSLGYPLFETA